MHIVQLYKTHARSLRSIPGAIIFNMRSGFCLVATLLFVLYANTSCFAQQYYDLKSCIAFGLKNNRISVQASNSGKIADAQGKEALAGYLPAVNITGGLNDNIVAQQSIIPAGIFGPNSIKVAFTQRYNTTAAVQLQQTIYDQSLLTGLKANRFNKEQAMLSQQQSDEGVIYNISTDYYQIYIYREQLALLTANLGTYTKQLDISRQQVANGTLLQTEMDKISVSYNNTLSQISSAENNAQLAVNQLKNDMGFPLDSALNLDTNSLAPPENTGVLRDSLNTFNINSRSDYQQTLTTGYSAEIDQ
jgi:outer membrane protein